MQLSTTQTLQVTTYAAVRRALATLPADQQRAMTSVGATGPVVDMRKVKA